MYTQKQKAHNGKVANIWQSLGSGFHMTYHCGWRHHHLCPDLMELLIGDEAGLTINLCYAS